MRSRSESADFTGMKGMEGIRQTLEGDKTLKLWVKGQRSATGHIISRPFVTPSV